jgi:hypothetical protein
MSTAGVIDNSNKLFTGVVVTSYKFNKIYCIREAGRYGLNLERDDVV